MRKIKETKKKTTNKITNKQVEEVSIDLKSAIKVFIIILVAFVIFYVLTVVVLDRRDKKKKNSDQNYPTLNTKSNDIVISDILKQKEEKYYVLAIKDESKDIYDLYTGNISEGFYSIDLNNALNKSIIGTEEVIAEDPKDIRIKDTTLFVVENNVITEHYTGKDEVVNQLKTIAF